MGSMGKYGNYGTQKLHTQFICPDSYSSHDSHDSHSSTFGERVTEAPDPTHARKAGTQNSSLLPLCHFGSMWFNWGVVNEEGGRAAWGYGPAKPS
jgi:hypothetical protein